ncbi:MAG: class IV adenylate cyclase [archaeon]|jgi:predicted adenylyl cyclase CyaB|nr:class IV adenylate cyclase [Sphaerochaetaceae bacterium]
MEIEKRAKLSNPQNVIDSLIKLGAVDLGEKIQVDDYFGSVELFKKLGYSFVARIRKSNEKFVLTVKTAKHNKDGVWEEYETELDEPKIFENMFFAMGFERVIKVTKTRKMFKLGEFTANIDYFEGRGTFIEVELISETDDSSKLGDILKKIGINEKDIIHIGYISMFLKEINSPYAEYIKN